MPIWMQGVVQHPWDPMVEIPTPPERGCGRLSYVWICCNYVEHREDYHAQFLICMIILLTSSIWSIVWGWKVMDLLSLVSNHDQRLDQNVIRNRLSSIGDDGLWYPKMYPHSFEEELGSGLHCDVLLAGDHNHHLGKSINNHENIIIFLLG
jgi:hypothetical protein